jgi:hypothetical protein
MEHRGDQAAHQEQQRDECAQGVEIAGLRRQHIDNAVGLAGEQRQKQTLADAEQGGQEDDGKRGMHG